MGNVRDVLRVQNRMRLPEIYPGGTEQLELRRQTASYLAATRGAAAHREVIERLAEEQCRALCRRGAADLSVLSSHLAAAVAAEMIGLTGSAGVAERLDRFFRIPGPQVRGLRAGRRKVSDNLSVLAFFWRDVRPAIADRRRSRRADLISHLIDGGCTRPEALGECVTFALAGMVAAREFITVAAWHLLTDDGLRARYTEGDEAGRAAVLLEILDQEPVIAGLLRWAGEDPAGDDRTSGDDIGEDRTTEFRTGTDRDADAGTGGGQGGSGGATRGRGPGRESAGVWIALAETDVFLGKLFAMPGLRLLREPTVIIRPDLAAYELKGLILAV